MAKKIQSYLEADMVHEFAATFDVKRIGVSPKNISAGLTFSLGEIDASELTYFAKRSGRLVVEKLTELNEADDPDADLGDI